MGKEGCQIKEARLLKGKRGKEDVNNFNGKKVFKNAETDNFTVLPKLSCIYTNADQLFNKLPELTVRTRDDKPKIIGITEVKPNMW